MKNIRKLTAIACLSLLTSCALDPPEVPAYEMYLRGFIKKFGLIDPTQDWNQAVESQVTLIPNRTIAAGKVYAKSSGRYYKVAELKNISEKVTIPIEIVATASEIKMVLDGSNYYTEIGGTVDMNKPQRSRSSRAGGVPTVLSEPSDPADRWLVMNGQQALSFFNTLPEGGPTVQKWDETEQRYKDKPAELYPGNLTNTSIRTDFTLVASEDKEIVIYPIYWNTSQDHELGLYYFVDENNASGDGGLTSADIVRIPLFTMSRPPRTEDLITGYTKDVAGQHQVVDGNGDPVYDGNGDPIMEDEYYTYVHKFYNPLTNVWQNTETGKRISNEVFNPNYDFPPISGERTRSFFFYNNRNYVVENGVYWDLSSANLFVNPSGGTEPTNAPYPIRQWSKDAYGRSFSGNVISRGIAINIPAGLHYGYYIHFTDVVWPHHEKYVYSEAVGNIDFMKNTYSYKDWTIDYDDIDEKDRKNTYCAIFDQPVGNTTYTYLTFEDWTPGINAYDHNVSRDYKSATSNWNYTNHPVEGATGDYDLNDVAFVVRHVDLNEELDVDQNFEFLLCAEDLGTTDDFDFNDMIVGVNVLTSMDGTEVKKYVTFTALAAGGTLPLYLHCQYNKNGVPTDETLFPDNMSGDPEWHRWFGIDSYGEMLNTFNNKPHYQGASVTIVADGDFKLSQYGRVDNTSGKGIGGIYITVNSENPDGEYDNYNPGRTITAPQPGQAPQMFLIEDKGYDGGNWAWPAEREAIEECYTDFLNWAGSAAWTGEGTPDDNWTASHYHYWYMAEPSGGTYTKR